MAMLGGLSGRGSIVPTKEPSAFEHDDERDERNESRVLHNKRLLDRDRTVHAQLVVTGL